MSSVIMFPLENNVTKWNKLPRSIIIGLGAYNIKTYEQLGEIVRKNKISHVLGKRSVVYLKEKFYRFETKHSHIIGIMPIISN